MMEKSFWGSQSFFSVENFYLWKHCIEILFCPSSPQNLGYGEQSLMSRWREAWVSFDISANHWAKTKLPRTTNWFKSCLKGMLTDAVYKENFNPFFPTHSHPRGNVRSWEEKQHVTLLGVCNRFFSLPRNASLHFLLPSQCLCFMKTEAPHEEVAMENLFQVKNSHYGKVACNLSADMQQLPCRAPNSCSRHLNAAWLC